MIDISQEELYAAEWDESAKFFYKNNRYQWMSEKVNGYDIILEIGCGTGYSTLSLVEAGHTVIAVDKNKNCLQKAKSLIQQSGVTDHVTFLEGDVAEESFRRYILEKCDFDVVTCWNVGTAWSKEMMEYYLPFFLEYGLTPQQIIEAPESSYGELIIWESCRLASKKGVPLHLIERGTQEINYQNDPWYKLLGKEFSFSRIYYDNLHAETISKSGRKLSTNGIPYEEETIKIVLSSVLME